MLYHMRCHSCVRVLSTVIRFVTAQEGVRVLLRADVSLSPNAEEVDDVKYVTLPELNAMMSPDTGKHVQRVCQNCKIRQTRRLCCVEHMPLRCRPASNPSEQGSKSDVSTGHHELVYHSHACYRGPLCC